MNVVYTFNNGANNGKKYGMEKEIKPNFSRSLGGDRAPNKAASTRRSNVQQCWQKSDEFVSARRNSGTTSQVEAEEQSNGTLLTKVAVMSRWPPAAMASTARATAAPGGSTT